jgi:hypothetical protein
MPVQPRARRTTCGLTGTGRQSEMKALSGNGFESQA